MTTDNKDFLIWKTARENVFSHDGKEVIPPAGWCFVPSGDPGLTRRLKAAGDYWTLVHRRKNRVESLGLWTSAATVEKTRAELEAERSDPAYLRKLESARRSREVKQSKYETEFREKVLKFLAFSPRWSAFAVKLADAVTAHAIPVGSGTVARTERIPVERRAEAAVIAWMRHQTTAYDRMSIARIRGERREVRRQLAERSREVLSQYRSGGEVDLSQCPLAKALK